MQEKERTSQECPTFPLHPGSDAGRDGHAVLGLVAAVDLAADVAHLGGGVDLVQDNPGVLGADLLLDVVLQLEARDYALPLLPHRRLETAGHRVRVHPVPQQSHRENSLFIKITPCKAKAHPSTRR